MRIKTETHKQRGASPLDGFQIAPARFYYRTMNIERRVKEAERRAKAEAKRARREARREQKTAGPAKA